MVDDVAMNYSHPGLKMREICNFGLKMREICNFGKEFGKGIGDIYKGCGIYIGDAG